MGLSLNLGLGPGLVLVLILMNVLVKAVLPTSQLSQLRGSDVFTKYYVLVVDDPAFIPKHPLFLVLEPLQDQIDISGVNMRRACVCVCV